MGYKEDIKIDKNNLDKEWTMQPELFMEWAEKAVNAQYERDCLKVEMDLCRAELDSDIRSNPSKYGLEKITESAITNSILTSKKYKEAQKVYLEAVRDANILKDVARDSFEQRKKALEKLTELYISGYYAQPSIPNSSRNEVEDRKKKLLRSEARNTRVGGRK